jgi:hypothetical protein
VGIIVRVDDSASNGARTISIVHRVDLAGDLFASILGEDAVAPIVLAPRSQQSPDIAAAGELRLVIWREDLTSERRRSVVALRVDADGNAVDWKPIDTGGSAISLTVPRVASNGTDWLAVWQDGRKVWGSRIRHDGTLADASPLLIADQAVADSIAVAWDGTSYVVVFARGDFLRIALRSMVFAARVPASGSPSAPFAVSALAWNWHVAIAGGPSGSLIVWSDYDRLNGALLSQSDTVTPLAFPAGSGHHPAAAWNRDTFLVVATTWGPDLRVMRVDAHGNVRESLAPITQESAQFPGYTITDVEPFGDAFLLLWSENELLAAVITREGLVADGPSPVGGDSPTFGAAGTQFVTQHPIDHPTHPSRVFIQSIDWTPEPTRRRRAAR